jgi:lipoprotein-anchoring transpeptidase ErfK/SrfK
MATSNAAAAPAKVAAVPAAAQWKLDRQRWILAGVGATLATLLLLFLLSTRLYVYDALGPVPDGPAAASAATPEEAAAFLKEIKDLDSKAKRAERNVAGMVPPSVYIVVDTAQNKLYLMKRDKVIHEALCSTGSGGLLKDPNGERQWVFETPRGNFRVIRKAEDPVWTKPDWAFVEEGKGVPSNWSERRDYDTLGDYALYLGDGYMIHGTLYQRYLGRAITHGCIRLGDEDLERVYRSAPVGTQVLIF